MDYWDDRKKCNYYKQTIRLAARFGWNAENVIEVGGGRTKMLEYLTWIPEKIALDLERKPQIAGALNIHADFMKYKPKKFHDLVICLQVLEHLPEPEVFLEKLFHTGKTIIISLPYKWPKGFCVHHIQDPIDEEKLLGWAKKDWLHFETAEDESVKRLITVFEGYIP